jgi:hypothetical protein
MRLRFLVMALGLLLLSVSDATAAPPDVVNLGQATGSQALTFTWNAVLGASWYYLWVNDEDAAPKFTRWYTAEEAGCVGTQAICSVTVALNWRPGAGRWWVRANNADGTGPWSAAQDFAIAQGRPFRIVDSSVPPKEVGFVYGDGEMIRRIGGVPRVIKVGVAGFRIDNSFSLYYTMPNCMGTAYAITLFPPRLLILGSGLTPAVATNLDEQVRTFQSRADWNAGYWVCNPETIGSQAVSVISSYDAIPELGGYVPPFKVAP